MARLKTYKINKSLKWSSSSSSLLLFQPILILFGCCCPLAGGAKCRKTKREKAEKEMNGETEEEASLADEILVEEALEILYRK